MADIDVRAYVGRLRQALPYVPPISVKEIKALHRRRDFGTIVRLIRSAMNVDVRLTLHWTNGPPPHQGAKAWIELPGKMPYYGTKEFKDLKLNISILKSFAAESTYHQFAIAVAHELSHVVLESIAHPLRSEEKAVDLTAMLLGFGCLYHTGARTVRCIGYNLFQRSKLGYLSDQELRVACKILVPQRTRAKRAALNCLQQSAGILIILALWAGIWAFVEASNLWSAHEIAVAEEAQLKNKIPIRYNDRMTLTEARAGLTSVTRVFRVNARPDMRVDFVAFERALHKNVCAAKSASIKKGVSYYYEYERPSGEAIAQFKINSCP